MSKYIRLETVVKVSRYEEWKIPVENFSDSEIQEIIQELTDDPEELWSYDPINTYCEDSDVEPVEIKFMEASDA